MLLIAYAGQTGTTAKCAQLLAGKLGESQEVELIDLTAATPDLSQYDKVIIGGNVRFGKLHAKASAFINEHQAELLPKPFGIFICNGLLNETDTTISNNINSALRERALAVSSFGGELDLDQLKGKDKLFATIMYKSVKSGKLPAPALSIEAIRDFTAKFV